MALFHIDKKTAPSSNYFAAQEAFDTLVYDSHTNDTLGPQTPRGALGGMLATLSGGDNTVNLCDNSLFPMGFFYNDAAGGAWENAPAVASGKIAVLPIAAGGDVIYVDVYETRNNADSADLTYSINDKVYSSPRGLVSNENLGGSQKSVGVVCKVPSTNDPRLGILVGYAN